MGGKTIPEDSHLLSLFASGNDETAVFENPHNFDPARKNLARHPSFSDCTRPCVAVALARMEAKIAMREIVKRFKNI